MAAQDLAHRAGQVVIPECVEDAAEVSEGVFVRFQERLLGGMQVAAVERRAAGHRAHGEHLHLGPLAGEIDPGFIPVNLRFLAEDVVLRHERLALVQPHLPFAGADVVAHRRFSHRGVGELPQNALVDAPRRVTLFARGATVLGQHLVDEGLDSPEPGLGPFRIVMARWHRAGQRLADNTAMHAELGGHAGNRADTELMLATDLLEQIHFGFPVHKRSPDASGEP